MEDRQSLTTLWIWKILGLQIAPQFVGKLIHPLAQFAQFAAQQVSSLWNSLGE